jgi:hypothetical protein
MSLLLMAIIRLAQCVVLIVVPGPVSTWWFVVCSLFVSGGI